MALQPTHPNGPSVAVSIFNSINLHAVFFTGLVTLLIFIVLHTNDDFHVMSVGGSFVKVLRQLWVKWMLLKAEHRSSWQKVGINSSCLYIFTVRVGGSYLTCSEAEGGGDCVRPLPVLQDQTPVLSQSQIMTRGEVTQPKGLPPADVASTPAVELRM